MAINKNINSINIDDLQALIENGVSEEKSLEFKQALPGNARDDKKEFLADVSSFANASGGLIIYGIKEKDGVAVELCGLQDLNIDSEILRLENLLRDNIKPRIPSIQIRNIELQAGDNILLIQIPKSWAQPHVVDFSGYWRFYARNSVGKYHLDVSELRSAFSLSETIAERIRLFRAERLGKISARETPAPLTKKAQVVLHIIPFGSLDVATENFDVANLINERDIPKPIYASGWNYRHNFDGFLTFSVTSDSPSSYLQFFRNGIVETVDERLLHYYQGNQPYIPSTLFERSLVNSLQKYLDIQKKLGVSPPLFVMLSLLGVVGYTMAVDQRISFLNDTNYPIDRDVLLIPEIMIEDFDCNVAEVLRPAFDAVWNAAGYSRSMNYDEQGQWMGNKQ